ncbi:Ig-like domain-containing protein [Haloferula helveola]|uniref:Ig-like domain-containing protein n=1 Tax=Haloferula helveola TaxID=490095 RepID=A0ABN6HAY4_9BACT|nr:Ig-like domain-containing protein [Haloferula helveola]
MRSRYPLSLALLGLAAALPAQAEIYTLPDIVRPSGEGVVDIHYNFNPNSGWSGTPPNAISDEESVYLRFTVSWTAAANIGSFQVGYNAGDNGSAGRWDVRTEGSGFSFYTANASSDLDGPNGPGTAKPGIDAVDTNTITSATFVLKADQVQAGISPADYPDQNNSLKDRWYADFTTPGAQDEACGFLYINPNLGAPESGQTTKWAAWRSGNASYQSVSFRTDTADTDLTFSNIAIYTGDDTPFATSTGIVDAGTSTVSASPSAVPADDTTTSTVTVTLKDAGGTPVSGKEVSLSGDASATIATSDNISDASGVVSFTVKSGAVGTETFTATDVTDSNLVITETASVDFEEVVMVGPVDAGNSSVVASPTDVPANGVTPSTVTVTLRDASGLLVVGEDVTLSGTPSGATISPSPTLATDVNGEAAFTVSSGTIGSVDFSATSSTDNITVTQTAAVNFTDPQDAESFNVNFLDEGQADSTGLVGVVGDPGETWNQGTTSVSSLVDTTGTVTSSVSVSGLGGDGRTLNADLNLFDGVRNLFGKGDDVTISITGLTPDAAYDIYIYSLSHNASPWGDITNSERGAGDFVTTNTVLGNGQSQFLDNATPGTSDDVFVPNGNYVSFESIVADGSGDISILVDAYDGDGDRGSASTRLHVNALQIRPASGMSADYTAWRDAYYPGLGLPDEDDDGDKLSNDYERTFGLDPTDGTSSNPYSAPFDPATGSFGYSRRTPSLANMNYKVWYTTDLETWLEDNAAYQAVSSASDDVELTDVTIDPNLLAEPRLFIQVRSTAVTGVDPEPSLVNLWGSGNTITLLFSEPMNASSASNPSNYSVTQDGVGDLSVTGATISSDGGSVTLTLGSTLGIDTGYTVDIDGVTSGTGQSLGLVNRQFTTWDDDPTGIKVFILAGQSNMVGFGNVEDGNTGPGALGSLRYLAVNNGSYPEYDYTSLLDDPGQPATSTFRNRSDVKVWWREGGNGNLGGPISKGDLGPPYKGRDSGKIGPEFGFGQILGDFYPSNDVLVIKCAWGGRDLAEKFRPPSAVADRGGQVGDFYSAIIDYTREVLTNLGTEFPEWSGQGYEIVGFGWHQGYNDRISGPFSAEYKDNLPDLVEDLRTVFNKPNMPFVVASTGMATGPAEAPPYTGYSEVERAQLWVAGVTQPAAVLSTDTRPFWRDPADSPATSGQGFHWNHNAETLFLIGKAMGDNMVTLLTP